MNCKIMKPLLTAFIATFLFQMLSAQEHFVQEHWWQVDKEVWSILKDHNNNRVLVGGDFAVAGPTHRFATEVGTVDAEVNFDFPTPNNDVWASASDGNGGWYIGGRFSTFGGQSRSRLAHVDENGEVTSWNPQVTGTLVREMHISGDTLFVGGTFSQVNGQSRGNIAAFDMNTGQLLPWAPNLNSSVEAIDTYNNIVLVGGYFNTVNGESRIRLVGLDRENEEIIEHIPQVNSTVEDIHVDGNTAYVCGLFTELGGQSRRYLGSFDLNTGAVSNLSHNFGSRCYSLSSDENRLYVGGQFNSVNGNTSLSRLIAINKSNNSTIGSWQPNITGGLSGVHNMIISNDTLFFSGDFTGVGGQSARSAAAIDLPSASPLDWTVITDRGTTKAISKHHDKLFVGGQYHTIGGVLRRGFIALDATSGQLDEWSENNTINVAGGPIRAMGLRNDTLYIGGSFTSVNGESRNNFAMYDMVNNELIDVNLDAVNGFSSSVHAIAVRNDTVFIGGTFQFLGGEPRTRLAAINAQGDLLPWSPDIPSGIVAALEIANDTLYVGGSIPSIDGDDRGNLASFDLTNGEWTDWAPSIGSTIRSIEATDDALYIGGQFMQVEGEPHLYFAKFDIMTRELEDWSFNITGDVSGSVRDVAHSPADETVFIGGFFENVEGSTRDRFASFDESNATLKSDWIPQFNDPIYFLDYENDTLFVGGSFSRIDGAARSGLAVFVKACDEAGTPVITTADTEVCPDEEVVLTVTSENLNDSEEWEWYDGSCCNTPIGSGTTLTVNPSGVVTYSVRGVGRCLESGPPESITIEAMDEENPEFLGGLDLVEFYVDPGICAAHGITLDEPQVDDNCGVEVIFNDAPSIFPVGITEVTWTAEDIHGNIATAIQEVLIIDNEAPEPELELLEDILSQCEVGELEAPTAIDACDETIIGEHDASLPLFETTLVNWTYEDESGNVATQTQWVIIEDTEAPIPDEVQLPEIDVFCELDELPIPTATDNCDGTIEGEHTMSLPITSSVLITWTFTDESGNEVTQNQQITIEEPDATVSVDEVTLIANYQDADTYQWVDCNAGNTPLSGENGTIFTPEENGLFAVIVTEDDCEVMSECVAVTSVSIQAHSSDDLFKLFPNPANNQVQIVWTGETLQGAVIRFFEMSGKLIYTEPFTATTKEFDLSQYSKGIYFIEISDDKGFSQKRKLIVM